MKCFDGYETRLIITVLVLVLPPSSVRLEAEDTWTQKTDMPTARYDLSASVVNGKIYAIGGGLSFNIKSGLKTVEEYDPVTDTWTRKEDMPTGRQAFSTSVVNGKIYAIGGVVTPPGSGLPTVEEYDPATDTWTKKADMPTARAGIGTSVVDGKIYVIGGVVYAPGAGISMVEVYDPVTDTWTRKADMPTARHFPGTSVVNGKIYAIGGIRHCDNPSSLSTVEEYDPATNIWTTKTHMPTARTNLRSAVVTGRIYAIGGAPSFSSTVFSTVEEYNPLTDTWTIKANMPTARMGFGASVVNGNIYVIGGSTSGLPFARISTVEEYDTGLNASQPDFNGDGLVDIRDLLRLIESWGRDDPLCDIAPPPFGDGVVDVLDLELLMSYWGQDVDDPTLIAHWALDEVEGAVAYDSAGMNDAIVIGEPVWQPDNGKVNGALQFDGIDDYLSTNPVLNPAGGVFSIVAWIRGGAPGQVVVSQEDGACWLMADTVNGALRTDLRTPGTTGRDGKPAGLPLICSTGVTDGDWHRVGFVWDGLFRHLYVDGIEVATDVSPLSGLASAEGGLYFGAGSTLDPRSFFSGLIDDIRIYNRVVSP